ncbi:penicillin acylase family protein [Portibacter lacus]|uniref:Beta-lactam antibiotic acylase n=1 Tax=Portibacter lacus TaxID=1099794 RepID=A0AA37SKY8_9BACT|nr:penicillin acylase family protein [Portibacter lacus]GLR15782.1 beta-lactam antibiotic acylase [Portibacter lacus]
MRYFKLVISLFLLIATIYLLSNPLNVGERSLPAIGDLINPFSGFWANAEKIENESDEFKAEGLKGNTSIKYDDRHVPHIFAENLSDLMFAQGYAIAKERLWQMDITTRSIEGKTAEILGESALSQDMTLRQKGMARSALLAVESWKKNERGYALVERFSDGINYFIDQLDPADYPLEFKLLGYEPQQWEPYRTALFIKAMAITLNSANNDMATTNALEVLGEEKFYDLYPDRNKKQSPIIEKGNWPSPAVSMNEVITNQINELFESIQRDDHHIFVGSNNFAVGGGKSASGHPVLANDPHLKLTLPSIWIEMHLVCPELNAYGVSLPGVPGIVIGFNEDISWGQTNVGQDVLDFYKMKWVDDEKRQYYIDGEIKDAEIVIEKFDVKGVGEVLDTVIYTEWGPVMKEEGRQTDLAQRWVSLDAPEPGEVDVFVNINQSKDFASFRNALRSFTAPAQNFIFSSKSGDIALSVVGKLPIKSDQQGRFIQDGSLSSSAWKGFIPFDELPMELNPERDFVASANQHSTDNGYPYYYNGGFEDYRGRYINSKLEGMTKVSSADLMNLQLDAYNLKAEEALPILLEELEQTKLSAKEKEVVDRLDDWNYTYTSNSIGASYFEEWWDVFYDMVFDEIVELRKEINVPYPEAFRLIELMEEEPDHWVFDVEDTDEVETLHSIVNQSLKKVGFDTLEVKAWSESRNTEINHLANIPAFASQKISSPGHRNTPNAISKYNGPSWRMVVEMTDPVKGYGIYPGGNSGNPGSQYYDNFVLDWADGQYYELNSSSDPDKIKLAYELTFKPKK